ncbi:2-keto-3-deoxy-galactonokinase [Amylibacter marinus]|uniref:2-keto-3-deoxy-galactonokinase n=1 Tax=Amylibacter marinus TaxID=1475483 RepID=A0ABQ5VS89_9RHOB|nr:2-dehydro-3-deoxygalactonokinase [Amylibacter marinus]GLQ34287.1 2-keto-3-deoxy-galactonokinase [Amylibacter marinus]
MEYNPNWIAVDWGTSNLRAWVMDAQNRPQHALESARGMGTLEPDQFEAALMALIDPYLPIGLVTEVLCCGMVGARQGWAEAAYVAVPAAPPTAKTALRVPTSDPRISVSIIPGMMQKSPADVMRGEETQILGVLHDDPEFDGVICLPGTHTKWAHISAGEVVSFRTFMTGETFALLSTRSVLRHSMAETDWDIRAFEDGLSTGLTDPKRVAANLFSLRATGLVDEASNLNAYSTLSGLLIGLELGGAKPYWLGQQVLIVGSGHQSEIYRHALVKQGADAKILSGDHITRLGLSQARA